MSRPSFYYYKRKIVFIIAFFLIFSGNAFSQFKVNQIVVSGNSEISADTVKALSGLSTKKNLSARDINDGFRRLSDSGLFQDVQINPVGNRLVITVLENPFLDVVGFEGNKIFKTSFLSQIVKSKARSTYSAGIVDEDVRQLLQLYREKGRFNAKVSPKKVLLEGKGLGLLFEIDEGPRTEIKSISFIGNNYFTDARLRSVIASSQKNLFSFISTSDDYSEHRQEEDRNAIEEFYRDRGFASAKVTSSVGSLSNDWKNFNLTYSIFEGSRVTISGFEIISNIAGLDPKLFYPLISIKEGDLYIGSKIERLLKKLEKKANNQGFSFAQVTIEKKKTEDPTSLNIVFVIENGPSLFVERIDIKGNNQTLDRVIRREFSISEGDAFNPVLIRKTEEKLRALGFFKELEVSVSPGSSSEKAIVTVEVEEAPTGSLNFGAGYSTDTEVSGTISLSERNFLGKGQRLLFEVLTSPSNKRVKFGFTEPAVLNRDLSASIDFMYLDVEPKQSSYTANESSVRTGFGFSLGPDSRLTTSFKLSEEKILVPDDTTSLILKDDAGTLSNAGITLNYINDKRNSIIKPSSGYLFMSDLSLSGLGGNHTFVKGSARGKFYNSFLNDKLTITGELEGGLIQMQKGFSRTIDRFSLGGQRLRGFQYGEIGPREGSEPLGGEKYAVSRLEANFPIGLPEELGFYGGLFAEAGSLWGLNYDDKKLVIDESNLKSMDSHIRSSIGFTLYWSTPIGPLQFNWAKPQQYLSGIDKTENFSFNLASQF
ncbi:MAG: outer membrane protein assembly factor BamA [Paracoccaceae bacterium]|nr:outer membrane protein assembly factor BamA [Paracoccaceae bacterium]